MNTGLEKMSKDELQRALLKVDREIETYYRDNSNVVVPMALKKRQKELAALLKKLEE